MAKQTMGEFIATLRKAKGYTQQQVADALGVSNKTVSVWETDRAYPDIMTLPALAELLGVTVDELLKGERSLENGEVTPDISEKSRKDILKRKLLGVSLKNTVLLCTGLALVLIFTVAVLLTAFAGLPKWAIILFFVMCLLGVVTVYILLFIFDRSTAVSAGIYIGGDNTPAENRFLLVTHMAFLKTAQILGLALIFGGCLNFIIISAVTQNITPFSLLIIEQYGYHRLAINALAWMCIFIPFGLGALTCYAAEAVKHAVVKRYALEEEVAADKKNFKLFNWLYLLTFTVTAVCCVFSGIYILETYTNTAIISFFMGAVVIVWAVCMAVYAKKRKNNRYKF